MSLLSLQFHSRFWHLRKEKRTFYDYGNMNIDSTKQGIFTYLCICFLTYAVSFWVIFILYYQCHIRAFSFSIYVDHLHLAAITFSHIRNKSPKIKFSKHLFHILLACLRSKNYESQKYSITRKENSWFISLVVPIHKSSKTFANF